MKKYFVMLAIGLLLKFILSNIHVGDASYINVEVVGIGFETGLTGRKLNHKTVSAEGESIQIEYVPEESLKPGDSIVLEVKKRLLFLPDEYFFYEKLDSEYE